MHRKGIFGFSAGACLILGLVLFGTGMFRGTSKQPDRSSMGGNATKPGSEAQNISFESVDVTAPSEGLFSFGYTIPAPALKDSKRLTAWINADPREIHSRLAAAVGGAQSMVCETGDYSLFKLLVSIEDVAGVGDAVTLGLPGCKSPNGFNHDLVERTAVIQALQEVDKDAAKDCRYGVLNEAADQIQGAADPSFLAEVEAGARKEILEYLAKRDLSKALQILKKEGNRWNPEWRAELFCGALKKDSQRASDALNSMERGASRDACIAALVSYLKGRQEIDMAKTWLEEIDQADLKSRTFLELQPK